MKWRTYTRYVDQQTGEVISKKVAESSYIITKIKTIETSYTVEKNIQYGTRTITRICTHEGKQRKLFDG